MSFLSASDVDAGPGTKDKAGGKVVIWLLLALLVVFGGLYVAAHYAAADKVPRGTTVSGVSIGGHPQDEAADRLQAGLADQVSAPVQAVVDGTPVSIEATEAGLAVDYEASVAEAGGEESWDPVRLWNYFTGGDDLDAVVTVDETALGALVTRLDAEDGRPVREGSLTFEGARFSQVTPRTGRSPRPRCHRRGALRRVARGRHGRAGARRGAAADRRRRPLGGPRVVRQRRRLRPRRADLR